MSIEEVYATLEALSLDPNPVQLPELDLSAPCPEGYSDDE